MERPLEERTVPIFCKKFRSEFFFSWHLWDVQTKSATEHHCPIKDHWKIHISLQRGSLLCPSDTLQCNLCNAGKRMWLMGLGVGAFCEGYWGLGVGVVAFQVGLSLSPGPPLCHGNEPWRGKRGDQASSLFPTFFNLLLNFQLNPFSNQVLVNVVFSSRNISWLAHHMDRIGQAGRWNSWWSTIATSVLAFILPFRQQFHLNCFVKIQPNWTSIWQEKTGDVGIVGKVLPHFCKAANVIYQQKLDFCISRTVKCKERDRLQPERGTQL